MTIPAWLARYPCTQTWAQHIKNAGPRLGGVDYAMSIGTVLRAPEGGGVLEWVTPATPVKDRPRWYNTGLGNAAAYRRPDGTRTVYAHCSRLAGGVPLSGNSGKSTGPHLHTHDVLADGATRAMPFSTISSTPAGGGSTPIDEKEDEMAKPIFYIASDNTGLDVGVGRDDVWVRSAPGEPLRRMTQSQWAEYNNARTPLADGSDYFWKPGTWFKAAFDEDNTVARYTIGAHPWMAATAGGDLIVTLEGTAKPA